MARTPSHDPAIRATISLPESILGKAREWAENNKITLSELIKQCLLKRLRTGK